MNLSVLICFITLIGGLSASPSKTKSDMSLINVFRRIKGILKRLDNTTEESFQSLESSLNTLLTESQRFEVTLGWILNANTDKVLNAVSALEIAIDKVSSIVTHIQTEIEALPDTKDIVSSGDGDLEGSIRLKNGNTLNEGIVENFHDYRWGTICDDANFGEYDARVVCRQLGCSKGFNMPSDTYRARRSSPWLNSLLCNGKETRLTECYSSGWTEKCSSSQASVYCANENDIPSIVSSGVIRLIDGRTPYEGTLETYYNNSWYTACDTGFWRPAYSHQTCQKLGFITGYNNLRRSMTFETSEEPGINIARCHGDLTSDCFSMEGCDPGADNVKTIYLMCDPPKPQYPDDGQIRLSGGRTSYQGQVEIYHEEQWGSICDDSFSTEDAWVVCRELGFRGGNVINMNTDVESRSVWIDRLECFGNEDRISECSSSGWNNDTINAWNQCEQRGFSFAGVACASPSSGDSNGFQIPG